MVMPLKTEAVIVKEALSGLAPVSIHMLDKSEISCLFDVSLGRTSSAVEEADAMIRLGTM
jgi:hypothetical protein